MLAKLSDDMSDFDSSEISGVDGGELAFSEDGGDDGGELGGEPGPSGGCCGAVIPAVTASVGDTSAVKASDGALNVVGLMLPTPLELSSVP